MRDWLMTHFPVTRRYRWRARPPFLVPRDLGISLLVPFRSDHERRQQTWDWLRRYWEHELPHAEIVMGTDNSFPFCKTAAINEAAGRAGGDIFVILDADCYIRGKVVQRCADKIRAARRRGQRLWFIPYRMFFRLTDEASRVVLDSDPAHPVRFPAEPQASAIENASTSVRSHWYGALISVLPVEAFYMAGMADTRFAGWGGEDVAFMHACDTLYARHRASANEVFHLWHPHIGTLNVDREWAGQDGPNANGRLTVRYARARGDRAKMAALVSEPGNPGRHHRPPHHHHHRPPPPPWSP